MVDKSLHNKYKVCYNIGNVFNIVDEFKNREYLSKTLEKFENG